MFSLCFSQYQRYLPLYFMKESNFKNKNKSVQSSSYGLNN